MHQRWENKTNKGIDTFTTTCLEMKHKRSKSIIERINYIDQNLMHYMFQKVEKKIHGRGTFADLANPFQTFFSIDERTKNDVFLRSVSLSKYQLRSWFIANSEQVVSDSSCPF